MFESNDDLLKLTRRHFLGRASCGIGSLALASLLNPRAFGATASGPEPRWTGIINPTHFVPRAKRVIHLFMSGGPSHLETFDNKPKLAELHGQPMP